MVPQQDATTLGTATQRVRWQLSESALHLLCKVPSTGTLLRWRRGKCAKQRVQGRTVRGIYRSRKMYQDRPWWHCPAKCDNQEQGHRRNHPIGACPQIHTPTRVSSEWYSLAQITF